MPPALPFKPYNGEIWRVVEAQHAVATAKLVDSNAEQDLLEQILEATKPPVPPACTHLHYLLCTPFRYGRYPINSRFRRMGETPGVFYAAEDPVTAMAEVVWQRRVFFEGSPETPLPRQPGPYTGFSISVRATRAVDLTAPPLSSRARDWTSPDDYSSCLALADEMQAADGQLIRYASVRHPEGAPNVAVLDCAAFTRAEPDRLQSWYIMLRPGRASIRCEHPKAAFDFTYGDTRLSFA